MGLQGSTVFGADDFYESFRAPKFHDFTAPEEPIDADAFFLTQPGMALKKAVVTEDVKAMAPKILKVTAQDVSKGGQGSPLPEETVRSSSNPCSYFLPLVMSNLKILSSASPFCACWSLGLLREI